MSFANTQYFYYALGAILLITIVLNRLNTNYFKWVKSFWFYERTLINRISSLFYLLGLFLLMLSLLDLRGPEVKIKGNIPDQRTIIVLDSSYSMLAEDVRPNRFVKSLQLARHFVKKAAGHQISVVLFSDIQKRLIPFTDDIDLIDSRLAALERANSVAGGSNISQAIEEAIGYFEFDSSDDDKSKTGNILVFTDAEESEGEFKVDIPSNVNLAIVGVGTLKGANIPLRFEDGSFRGYKSYKGEPVLTKLDENYIRKIGKNVKSFKYWIANSYSLPTDDIVNFFRGAYTKKQGRGDLRIRPVYSHYILIPAIILYCISIFLGRFATFKTAKIILVIFATIFSIHNTMASSEESKNEKDFTLEIKKDLSLIKEGKADRQYILKVAEKILKSGDEIRAQELYSEYVKNSDDDEIKFNYATSLLKSNKFQEALPLVQDLMKKSKDNELKKKLKNNLLLSLDENRQKDKENKDNKENKNNKEKQENKDNQSQNKNPKDNGKKPEDKKSDTKSGGKPDEKPQGKKDDQSKPDKKSEAKDEKQEDKGQKDEPQTIEEKEKKIEQKRKMVKTPAMIKQILSDDRELQKKMMDTTTNERGEQKPKRDW